MTDEARNSRAQFSVQKSVPPRVISKTKTKNKTQITQQQNKTKMKKGRSILQVEGRWWGKFSIGRRLLPLFGSLQPNFSFYFVFLKKNSRRKDYKLSF